MNFFPPPNSLSPPFPPSLSPRYGCGYQEEAPAQPAMDMKMNQKVMDFYLNYTTRDKEGKLKVHSLPKEWVELFKEVYFFIYLSAY